MSWKCRISLSIEFKPTCCFLDPKIQMKFENLFILLNEQTKKLETYLQKNGLSLNCKHILGQLQIPWMPEIVPTSFQLQFLASNQGQLFICISSTGHLIVANTLFQRNGIPFLLRSQPIRSHLLVITSTSNNMVFSFSF